MGATTRRERAVERFAVQLKVELEGGDAVTRDMSASGVYFESDRVYAVGSRISFTIVFETDVGPLHATCDGEVIRVEDHGRRIGVAAKFDGMEFHPIGVPAHVV